MVNMGAAGPVRLRRQWHAHAGGHAVEVESVPHVMPEGHVPQRQRFPEMLPHATAGPTHAQVLASHVMPAGQRAPKPQPDWPQ